MLHDRVGDGLQRAVVRGRSRRERREALPLLCILPQLQAVHLRHPVLQDDRERRRLTVVRQAEHEPQLARARLAVARVVREIDAVHDRDQPEGRLLQIEVSSTARRQPLLDDVVHVRTRGNRRAVDRLGRQPLVEPLANELRRCDPGGGLIGHFAHQDANDHGPPAFEPATHGLPVRVLSPTTFGSRTSSERSGFMIGSGSGPGKSNGDSTRTPR